MLIKNQYNIDSFSFFVLLQNFWFFNLKEEAWGGMNIV